MCIKCSLLYIKDKVRFIICFKKFRTSPRNRCLYIIVEVRQIQYLNVCANLQQLTSINILRRNHRALFTIDLRTFIRSRSSSLLLLLLLAPTTAATRLLSAVPATVTVLVFSGLAAVSVAVVRTVPVVSSPVAGASASTCPATVTWPLPTTYYLAYHCHVDQHHCDVPRRALCHV